MTSKSCVFVACEGVGGLGGNRTPVQGFAVLCVATPPRGRRMSDTRTPCLLATSRTGGKAGDQKCFVHRRNKSLCNPSRACYMPAHADARSPIAQLVEHSTVNRMVAGSSPARGAITARFQFLSQNPALLRPRRLRRAPRMLRAPTLLLPALGVSA